jgi:D-alanyl-D-alanine carboxypeptidase (penicillin-binding protein 5/6)
LAQRTWKSVSWRFERARIGVRIAGLAVALALIAGAGVPLPGARAQSNPSSQLPQPPLAIPECKAASAILVDAATGTILWEKNSRVRRPMASTTKIMTATVLLETARLTDLVAFSEYARKTEYANLNMKPGEKIPMRDLLYAILLRSSNDGCVAAAEHIDGAPWKFVQRMNQKARELGALDTHFVTTNGLYDSQHYSTAYDLSLMTRYAIQNPMFNQIVGTPEVQISRSINWKDTLIKNHNKFLLRYAGADGIKTGYVSQSGRCLVASATRMEGGRPWRLISVVLKSPDMYGESSRLMDWGFQNFQPVFVARQGERVGEAGVDGGTIPQVSLAVSRDLSVVVRRDLGNSLQREIRTAGTLKAPIRQDQVAGHVVALAAGVPIGEVEVVATRPVSQLWTASVLPWPGLSMGLAALLLGPRYVRKIAKSARRRGRRVTARRGDPDRGGPGLG